MLTYSLNMRWHKVCEDACNTPHMATTKSSSTTRKTKSAAAKKKSTAKKSGTTKKNKLGVENSLVNNINARKKKGITRSKKRRTVTKKAYSKMEDNWGKLD